ncbi:MAG: carbon-nitrogen hydrolase family protein [Planctomycetota bacterium]|nr:carbon-nitrogen hydrolase family protein [Planctomycetota bacterium]
MEKFKVAGVQMDIQLGQVEANLDRVIQFLQTTVEQGALLTVFPECTLTGYCFNSLDEAVPYTEAADGPSLSRLGTACRELDTMAIVGFLEREGEHVFNSLALVDGSGVLGTYRKVHLPMLGIDRFTMPGSGPFEVIPTRLGRLGMNICYDSSFPEASRVLALQGADLICLPTNWPPTSGLTADVIPDARALENHVYFMSVNRVGSERGFDFIGKSKICDPRGAVLAFANHQREEILYGDVDPQFARQKHLVNIPGEHEVHRFEDRRPSTYQRIVE